MIRVAVDSNDPHFLEKSKRALMYATFYCPQRDGTLVTQEGKIAVLKGEPYQGPTVPTWRADAVIKDQPGLGISAGEIRDGVYRNSGLGLQYELPEGWDILQTEVSRDPPEDARDLREYELLRACSRILLRAMQHGSSDAAQQGPRPAIIVRALDLSCLSTQATASLEDKRVADEIAADLELFSEFGEIKSDAMASFSGRPFVVLHGTIGWHEQDDTLAHRMSEVLFATQDHNLLLLWSLMAPTSSELEAMPVSKITFDDSQPVRLPPVELQR